MSEHWTKKLIDLDACKEGVEWAKNYKTLQEAWDACECSDWMEWLLNMTGWWASARKKYRRACAGVWEEYERASAPAWEKYQRDCASFIRKVVPNPEMGS